MREWAARLPTAAKVAVPAGSIGNVTTETRQAFTESGFGEIVAALP